MEPSRRLQESSPPLDYFSRKMRSGGIAFFSVTKAQTGRNCLLSFDYGKRLESGNFPADPETVDDFNYP